MDGKRSFLLRGTATGSGRIQGTLICLSITVTTFLPYHLESKAGKNPPGASRVAQVKKLLPSKCEALSSNPSMKKKTQ
jgi:hypothetical protein